jgi:hypothetical protein
MVLVGFLWIIKFLTFLYVDPLMDPYRSVYLDGDFFVSSKKKEKFFIFVHT